MSLSIILCGLFTFLIYGMTNGLHKEIISSTDVNMDTVHHFSAALPPQSQTPPSLQISPQVVVDDRVEEIYDMTFNQEAMLKRGKVYYSVFGNLIFDS